MTVVNFLRTCGFSLVLGPGWGIQILTMSDFNSFCFFGGHPVYQYVMICRLSDIFGKHLSVIKRAGVVPYVVFDGLLLPAKASEVESRRR